MEKYFYLFGASACRAYENGFDELLQAVKEGVDFHTFVYSKDMHPNVLLNVFSGYEYYMELSEDEYDQLKNA